MCKSQITLRKFLKLVLEVYFYSVVIFAIFAATGRETFSPMRIVQLIMPVWSFETNFVSCFIGFWLTIPFLNILVNNMTKRQHQMLLVLLLSMYTILGSIPGFKVAMNYVTWFAVIYFMASYIRLYPSSITENKNLWKWTTIALFAITSLVIVVMQHYLKAGPFFVSDSNKILAVAIAVSSFLWFKNMNISHSRLINMIGGSTFAVLLIHTNSDAMRQWLWKDTIDCVGHYDLPLGQLAGYSCLVVLVIFTICILIDRIRIKILEEPFFKWYDNKYAKRI